MKNKIAILAGNYREFLNFVNQKEIVKDSCEYIYVDRVEKAYGFEFFDYKVFGTFWENRKDCTDILPCLKATGFYGRKTLLRCHLSLARTALTDDSFRLQLKNVFGRKRNIESRI